MNTTFLIAHTNSAGSGIAQATITVEPTPDMTDDENARRQFAILYPERNISRVDKREGNK